MDIKEHTTPEKLEYYAFLWSEAKMVIAAVSLFFGAVPIAYKILGMNAVSSLLPLFWLISGAASAYLLYCWHKGGQKVFGGKDTKDLTAFFVLVVTGLNLGLTAVGGNIGMSLVFEMPVADILFKATAVVYLIAAWYLWQRWNANGQKLF